MDCFEDENNEFKKQADVLFQLMTFFIISMFPFVAKLFRLQLINPTSVKYFTNVSKQIAKHRAAPGAENNDIMRSLIKASEEHPDQMDEEIMYKTCVQFFTDGYLTAGDALSSVFYLLAVNPEVQEKAQEELDEVFDGKSGDLNLTDEDLKSVPYLDQVLNESFRLGC